MFLYKIKQLKMSLSFHKVKYQSFSIHTKNSLCYKVFFVPADPEVVLESDFWFPNFFSQTSWAKSQLFAPTKLPWQTLNCKYFSFYPQKAAWWGWVSESPVISIFEWTGLGCLMPHSHCAGRFMAALECLCAVYPEKNLDKGSGHHRMDPGEEWPGLALPWL